MKRPHIRRGAASASTIILIIAAVLFAILLVIGCVGVIAMMIMQPAIGQARERAMELRSAAQLRQIDITSDIWRRDAGPDAALTFEALIEGDYATPELFRSMFGPAPDGGDDYWLLHPKPDFDDDPVAADAVIGYDRAMYATHARVAVLFADGRSEVLDAAEFERLLRSPPNDEIDFNLPPRQPSQ